jgi:GT2 family glycosyltransferase
MVNNKKVIIVILNWNGTELLRKYLPSVIQHSHDPDVSVVVADNGSTDGSVKFVSEYFPSVKTIQLDKNYGFAGGYNEVLKQIDADYFVVLNNDVEVTPNWIEPCIERMESSKNILVVQPKVLSYNQRDRFEYAGATGGFIDKYGYPFCRGRILNIVEKDEDQYNQPTPIFWATGACLFVKAKFLIEMGGFDPDFWAHMEEIDFCWRVKNRGFSVWYEPRSIVYHLGGGTLNYDNPKKIYLNFRNNLLMLLKNLPKGRLFYILFCRMVLDGIAAIRFLAGFNGKAFLAVLKAHIFFYSNFSKFMEKRRNLLPLVIKPQHPEVFHGSIMLRFFIQGKRKFTDLKFKNYRDA